MQVFLNLALAILVSADNQEGKETLYLFPTQPYVLSVPARHGHVMLKTSEDGGLAVSHMDPIKGEWSTPQPISSQPLWTPSYQKAQAAPQGYTKTAVAPGPSDFQMAPHPVQNNWQQKNQGHLANSNWYKNMNTQPAVPYQDYSPVAYTQHSNPMPMAASPMVAGLWMEDMKNNGYTKQQDMQSGNDQNNAAVVAADKGADTAYDGKAGKKGAYDKKDKSKDSKKNKSKKKSGSSNSAQTGKKNKTKKESSIPALRNTAVIGSAIASILFWCM